MLRVDIMASENTKGVVSAVNFHLTSRCNYRCGFCFSSMPTEVEVGPDFWMKALDDLWDLGIRKVNFVGGEPLLYNGLEDICRRAHELGYYTSIVSNGSLATRERLEGFRGILDSIGFSVDSMSEEVECRTGRGCPRHRHLDGVRAASEAAHELGFDVKLNITVIAESAGDDFAPLIREIDPFRVKVFRVTKLDNVNSEGFGRFEVSDRQFRAFVRKHRGIVLSSGRVPVFEDSDVLAGGYLMLDPSGRFKMEYEGGLAYVPYEQGLSDLDGLVDVRAFVKRGGNYFMEPGNRTGAATEVSGTTAV